MQNSDNTRAMRPEDIPQRPLQPADPDVIEATHTFAAPPVSPPTQDVLLTDEARLKQLESELSRLGMSPDEVRRLLFARANTSEPTPLEGKGKREKGKEYATPASAPPRGDIPATPLLPTTPPARQSSRVNADSLQQFAAQLTSNAAAARVQEIEEVNLDLPEFRESSVAEVRQAEQLLREASMLRRREKYADAMGKCREALLLTPKDAAALELLGDLYQGVAQVNQALAAYKRATEADPKRAASERKYADLLMRQQNWGSGTDPEAVPKNGLVASLLSLVVPGAGQFYNGETGKGLFFVLGTLVSLFLIFWSPWGLNSKQKGISTTLIATLIFFGVLYIMAVADANMTARGVKSRRRPRTGSGWEV
jgi:TM2 domain-containing membrane protein YozV